MMRWLGSDESEQLLLVERIGLRTLGQFGRANEERVREQRQHALARPAAGFIAVREQGHGAGSAIAQQRDLLK